MDTDQTYPGMPADADERVIRPSASFKKSVTRVTLAMLFFILTYLVMFTLALAIAAGLGFVGIWIMMVKISLITLALGAGLILSGLLLVYFLIKFIFSSQETDNSNKVEVTEDE